MVKKELFDKILSLMKDDHMALTNAVKKVTEKGLPTFMDILDDAQREELTITNKRLLRVKKLARIKRRRQNKSKGKQS